MCTHSGQPGPHPDSVPTCAPFCAPPCTLHAIFSWVLLTPTPLPVPWDTSISIPWPMGREILLSGQDSDLSSLGAYEGLALRGRGTGVPLPTYRYTTQCLAPQILDLHYNTTPPQSLSLPVYWCTGAPADSLLLSATHSKSQGHAIWSRLSRGLVGWVRVLGELWMCIG